MKSKLLLDPEDYETITERNFDEDFVLPYLARQNRKCAYCGERGDTKDHVVPKSRGGSDDPSNLVWACRSCNSRKGARTPEEAGMSILFFNDPRSE